MLNYDIIKSNDCYNWVICLHGFGGNHNIFYKQKDLLSQYFNLLLIDLPGHGNSKSINRVYKVEPIVNSIINIMDDLKIEKAHLFGVSLGTLFTHYFTNVYKERVITSILVGAAVKWRWWGIFLLKILLLKPLLLRWLVPKKLAYKIFAFLLMPKINHKKAREIFIREAKKFSSNECLKWADFVTLSDHYFLKDYNDNVPKLYIMGEEDHMFLDGLKERLRYTPNSELIIIPKCGHVCNIEDSSTFNPHMLNFLLKHND